MPCHRQPLTGHAPAGPSAAGDTIRSLLYTSGSPFARAVRILLDELGLDCARNEALSAPGAKDPASAPSLQVPVLRDGAVTLRESGTICEYLLATYPERPAAPPPLARHAFRPEEPRRDRLVFSTTQTFGTVATTISQMTRTGVGVTDNDHLARSAERLDHILGWLEGQIGAPTGHRARARQVPPHRGTAGAAGRAGQFQGQPHLVVGARRDRIRARRHADPWRRNLNGGRA
ncbi:MAG: hypothetical protein D6686_02650 [Alphaproteobacteria bacterium]|nr:MAG: hypothetical protein D6686_02650 [Alphaproteobacteria bacterium]